MSSSYKHRANLFPQIASPSIVYGLSISNLILLVSSLIVGIIGFYQVSESSTIKETGNLSGAGIFGNILLFFYFLNIIGQLYIGTAYLYTGVQNRNVGKCRTWFVGSVNLIALEILTLVFFTFLGFDMKFFQSYSMFLLMYKFFQLWPVDTFIENLECCLRPLIQSESESHI